MRTLVTSFILAILLLGCSKKEQPQPSPLQTDAAQEQTQTKSDLDLVLDAVTGKQAIDQGRNMTDKINKIQADRQKQLDELEAFETD